MSNRRDRFAPVGDDDDRTTVRVLSKGLHVLRVLNEHYELSALELCRITGIPRPTIHRLLNTLIADGYVAWTPATRRYRATIRVQALSQGYREESWISEVALPVLKRLQSAVVWPSDVATYQDGAMVVRQTTNDTSPVSIVGERVGSRISTLKSAMGRAFVAFSDPQTREVILDILASPQSIDYDVMRDRPKVVAMLDQIRRDGYAERIGGIVPRTFSLAVPILSEGVCVASLNIICFSSAIKLSRAKVELLPRIRAAAADIEEGLAGAAPDARVHMADRSRRRVDA